MPQMAPIMWLNMYMMFNLMMMTTITMIYFYYPMMPLKNKMSKIKTKMNNWLW